MKTIWLCTAMMLTSLSPARASSGIDCSKANSQIEQLICSDNGLLSLDRQLADAYEAALKTGTVQKKLQIDWIKHNDECLDKSRSNPKSCLEFRMTERIKDLQGPGIWFGQQVNNGYTPQPPSVKDFEEVCSYVASRGPSISGELISDGILDANNDGIEDRVTVSHEGTAWVSSLEFRPKEASEGASPVEIELKGFDSSDYGYDSAWLKYRGRAYTINFDDETRNHVIYLGFITPDNVRHVACDFDSDAREILNPSQEKYKNVCLYVSQNREKIEKAIDESPDEVEGAGRWSTSISGHMSIDINNENHSVPLELLDFAGTAGRGCDFEYYDVPADKTGARKGHEHDLLMQLQDVDPESPSSPGRTCKGNIAKWFEYEGKIYFDNSGDLFHQVKIVEDDKVKKICSGDYEITWKVKSVLPDL